MATDRTANVIWQGDLASGSGTIESVTSGVLEDSVFVGVALRGAERRRAGGADRGRLGSCFSMACRRAWQGGTPPSASTSR